MKPPSSNENNGFSPFPSRVSGGDFRVVHGVQPVTRKRLCSTGCWDVFPQGLAPLLLPPPAPTAGPIGKRQLKWPLLVRLGTCRSSMLLSPGLKISGRAQTVRAEEPMLYPPPPPPPTYPAGSAERIRCCFIALYQTVCVPGTLCP